MRSFVLNAIRDTDYHLLATARSPLQAVQPVVVPSSTSRCASSVPMDTTSTATRPAPSQTPSARASTRTTATASAATPATNSPTANAMSTTPQILTPSARHSLMELALLARRATTSTLLWSASRSILFVRSSITITAYAPPATVALPSSMAYASCQSVHLFPIQTASLSILMVSALLVRRAITLIKLMSAR